MPVHLSSCNTHGKGWHSTAHTARTLTQSQGRLPQSRETITCSSRGVSSTVAQQVMKSQTTTKNCHGRSPLFHQSAASTRGCVDESDSSSWIQHGTCTRPREHFSAAPDCLYQTGARTESRTLNLEPGFKLLASIASNTEIT